MNDFSGQDCNSYKLDLTKLYMAVVVQWLECTVVDYREVEKLQFLPSVDEIRETRVRFSPSALMIRGDLR